MKYKVVYDKGNRLRIRAGKDAFTKEEGYGLVNFFSSLKPYGISFKIVRTNSSASIFL